MYLALIINPEQPVPPIGYGGTERQADIWIRQLIAKGHKVDLFAGPGSKSPATNLYLLEQPWGGFEPVLARLLWNRRDRYDCIIDATAFHLPGMNKELKTVSLMLGDPFRKYPHDDVKNRVYGSRELAEFYGCPNHPVLLNIVHNEPNSVPLGKGEYSPVLYVGKIHPMKGVHIAAEACFSLGCALSIWGPVSDGKYWESFKDKYRCIRYGVLGTKEPARWEVFGRSEVFVHPTQCCDCDPLAPKEAMLTGTPVVACPDGGIRSSVKEGVSGYFAKTVNEFKEAILKAGELDRQKVRDWILPKLDPSVYVDKLLELCEQAMNGKVW